MSSSYQEKTEYCDRCGNEKRYVDCYNCGGECFSYHDCGEDTCCCVNPVDNMTCDICEGDGGWMQCTLCFPED